MDCHWPALPPELAERRRLELERRRDRRQEPRRPALEARQAALLLVLRPEDAEPAARRRLERRRPAQPAARRLQLAAC
jgi:hypothetical protein